MRVIETKAGVLYDLKVWDIGAAEDDIATWCEYNLDKGLYLYVSSDNVSMFGQDIQEYLGWIDDGVVDYDIVEFIQGGENE